MAYLNKAGQFLVTEDSVDIGTLTFGTPGVGRQRVTISFHEVINGLIALFTATPTSAICSSRSYALQVNVDTPSGITNGFLGKSTIDPSTGRVLYSVYYPVPTGTTDQLTLFSLLVTGEVILLNTPFTGTLRAADGVQQFTLTASPTFQAVGYAAPLSSVLSNCSICGCAPGKVCLPGGVCAINPCSPQAACGDGGGLCPGPCPSGTLCATVGGLFRCMQTPTSTNYGLWIAIGIIILLLLVIFIYGMYRLATRKATAYIPLA